MNIQAGDLTPVSSPTDAASRDTVSATVDRLAAELGEMPLPLKTRAGQPWVGLTTAYGVYVAYNAATRARINAEAERLLWAADCGLPVPQVVTRDSDWLITARAANDELLSDGSYAAAAVAVARQVSAEMPARHQFAGPPAHGDGGHAARGANGARLVRLGRMLWGKVPYHEYRSLQRAVAGLPKNRLAHGDFHQGNILFDRARRTVTVVDWEHLAYRPAHSDLCSLWPRLVSAADREVVLEALLADTSDRAALGVLHHWFALLRLVNQVAKPRSKWNLERITAAQERVGESRANATRWRT